MLHGILRDVRSSKCIVTEIPLQPEGAGEGGQDTEGSRDLTPSPLPSPSKEREDEDVRESQRGPALGGGRRGDPPEAEGGAEPAPLRIATAPEASRANLPGCGIDAFARLADRSLHGRNSLGGEGPE
jgi:hypothetical protein